MARKSRYLGYMKGLQKISKHERKMCIRDRYNTGQSKGSQESYNMNYQKLGKDLMTMDELAVMDGSKCIVQVRGVRPFLSDKYDLTQHPNYKLTADYDKRNYFDVVKFLSHNLILKADDEYQVIDLTE